jgi:hypothetical protein
MRIVQLTVAAAVRSKAVKKSAVTAAEDTDAVGIFGDSNDIAVSAHAGRTAELTLADEAVEIKVTRRQYWDAVVIAVCHEHKVVGGYPHLTWIGKLQRSSALAADDAHARASVQIKHVNAM